MNPIKVIQFGCGKMSRYLVRYAYESGAKIVGAIDVDPALIGKDIGEHAGIGKKLGIPITDDAESVLKESGADIALVTTFSFLKDIAEAVKLCVEHGISVITTCEEAIYPWGTSPLLTGEIDRLAKKNGCTVVGSGMQDIFWIHSVACLCGGCHTIQKISGAYSYNVDDYGLALALAHGVDLTPEEFEQTIAHPTETIPSYAWNASEALAHKLGLTVRSIRQRHLPQYADEPILCQTLGRTIEPGRCIGMAAEVTILTKEGILIEEKTIGKVYRKGEGDLCDWKISGDPPLQFAVDKPQTVEHTCATVINRLPDVLAAPCGFVTADDLPEVSYPITGLTHQSRNGD